MTGGDGRPDVRRLHRLARFQDTARAVLDQLREDGELTGLEERLHDAEGGPVDTDDEDLDTGLVGERPQFVERCHAHAGVGAGARHQGQECESPQRDTGGPRDSRDKGQGEAPVQQKAHDLCRAGPRRISPGWRQRGSCAPPRRRRSASTGALAAGVLVGVGLLPPGQVSRVVDLVRRRVASRPLEVVLEPAHRAQGVVEACRALAIAVPFTRVEDETHRCLSANLLPPKTDPDLPPTVSIDRPHPDARVQYYRYITLSGDAFDTEDGDLSGTIRWRSNRSGFLGTGRQILGRLRYWGSDVITAEVFDRSGQVHRFSINVYVQRPVQPERRHLVRRSGSRRLRGV